ncbi:MAG: hypothetical protein L0220_32875, partial [Acidobacteria bacterium]|nr:hypothetical protein [Acidobacteriota bacterium]
DITENYNVLGLDITKICSAATPGTDNREIQFVVQVSATNDRWRGERYDTGSGSLVKKLPPRLFLACYIRGTGFS